MKSEEESNNSSEKQVHLWVESQLFRMWDQYRRSRGIKTMSAFITSCVNDVVLPMPNHNQAENIQKQIQELENIYQSMDEKLDKIVEKRENLLSLDGKNAESNPELSDSILNYLMTMGESNEFLICKDLNSDIQRTYEILCNLKTQKKVTQTEELSWKIV